MTDWNYMLEPDEDARAQEIHDRVWDWSNGDILDISANLGWLPEDENGKAIKEASAKELERLRERLEEFLYEDEGSR